MATAYVIGTHDTKSDELGYVARLVDAAGVGVMRVDVSTSGGGDSGSAGVDVTAAEVAAAHPDGPGAVFTGDRGTAVGALAVALETELDRAAESNPNPGRPSLHRLNRTEYQNAVRDLLDVEIDATSLLPADDSSQGSR